MQKIMVVEDSDSDQFLNELVIKSVNENIEIIKAYDGQEAIEILESGENPDVILLDINMPRMNGHEFLEEYYKEKEQDIPVVVMLTSSDQEKDKEQTQSYACVRDYILKPLEEKDMDKIKAVTG